MITLAWSSVFAILSNYPITYLLDRLFFTDSNSSYAFLFIIPFSSTGVMESMCYEIGRMFNSSSITIQLLFLLKESKNLSLKRGYTSLKASVRYLWCESITNVCSCFKLVIVLSRNITSPPPYTVSMVLHSKFGVKASKSWRTRIWYVFPKILWLYL